MRTPFIVGNWKMNLNRVDAEHLARSIAEQAHGKQVRIGVCPPFPYLSNVKAALGNSPVLLGAQNIYFEEKGAFTGEVSASMILDVGCTFTLLGHSERRLMLGESDAVVNKKMATAMKAGLHAILCIGETLDQRQANQTEAVVEAQLKGSLAGINFVPEKITLAYEPVWAIGTGVVATPDQAEQVHQFIRKWLTQNYSASVAESTCIQYGGSVNPGNAKILLAQPNVDGLLVGGASLKLQDFSAITAVGA
ncbi:MAG TPA: triose-phosphate isomerase [Gemmatales bacterium]|nr:triose-phosphate isomerase [Gemmatales bacterium]HMP17621.1 triose-phosphate isomerase [Gemmatales bacterium]